MPTFGVRDRDQTHAPVFIVAALYATNASEEEGKRERALGIKVFRRNTSVSI